MNFVFEESNQIENWIEGWMQGLLCIVIIIKNPHRFWDTYIFFWSDYCRCWSYLPFTIQLWKTCGYICIRIMSKKACFEFEPILYMGFLFRETSLLHNIFLMNWMWPSLLNFLFFMYLCLMFVTIRSIIIFENRTFIPFGEYIYWINIIIVLLFLNLFRSHCLFSVFTIHHILFISLVLLWSTLFSRMPHQ